MRAGGTMHGVRIDHLPRARMPGCCQGVLSRAVCVLICFWKWQILFCAYQLQDAWHNMNQHAISAPY